MLADCPIYYEAPIQMKKFLLCYDLTMEEGDYRSGWTCISMNALTEANLVEAAYGIKERQREIGHQVRNVIWRSITPLEG